MLASLPERNLVMAASGEEKLAGFRAHEIASGLAGFWERRRI
jgi:hypothetical protein